MDHRRHIVKGDPHRIVPALAERLGADVVVLGAPERGRIARLWSTTLVDRVTRNVGCDVVAVGLPRATADSEHRA